MRQFAPFAAGVLTVTGCVAPGLYPHLVAHNEPNTTRPQFAAAAGSPVAVGPMAQKVLVADMNGDANPDIVLTCGGTTQDKPDPKKGFVALLLGDGRGGFRLAQPLIPLGADGLKAAVGDLNGDKRPDIVVIAHDSYAVTMLLQDERSRFDAGRKRTVPASKGDHPHTHDVAVADVNGDGNLDILTTNAEDGNVSVLMGDGAGGFQPARGSPFAAGRHPYEGLSVGDLNSDGKPDVAVPDLLGKAVTVLLGDGVGGFAAALASPFAVGDRPGFVTLGDLTGDSRPDIMATHDDDPIVHVLRGDGRGGFRPAAGSPVRLKENVWGAVIADVDADGKNDLVVGAQKGHVIILLGDGAGGFGKDPVLVPVGGKAPGNVAVADVNRDGKLDLVTSNYESGDVSVLVQQ
jgi:hypothetical protein